MGSKTMLVILILLSVMWKLHYGCQDDEFQVNSICCSFCDSAWYVEKNCSSVRGMYEGVGCHPCSVCADGWTLIANCTLFSDTKCVMADVTTPKLPASTFSTILTPGPDHSTALFLIVVPLAFLLLVLAVAFKMYMRREPVRDHAPKKSGPAPLSAVVVLDESKKLIK